MQKLGMTVEADSRSLIVAGDGEQIVQLFMRIERFLNKVAGKLINYDILKD